MRVICFDLWGTLIRSSQGNGASYQDVLIGLGARHEDVYPIVRDRLMVDCFTYEQMAMSLCSELTLRPTTTDVTEVVNLWRQDNENVEWIEEAERFLKTVRRQGAVVALATNITAPAWEAVEKSLNLSQYFDFIFRSCEYGFSKPDRRVWEMISNHSPDASEYWMVGDNDTDDLTVPRAIGWQTVLVGSNGAPIFSAYNRIYGGKCDT